jgi:hypothetical protein
MAKEKPDLVLDPFGWSANMSAWPAEGATFPPLVLPAATTMDTTILIANPIGQILGNVWNGHTFGGWSLAANASSFVLATAADRNVDVVLVDVQVLPHATP